MAIVPERFWMRRGIFDDLYAENELLHSGEFCVELIDEDGYESMWFKIGNDTDHWRDLLWAGWGLFDRTDLADGMVPQYDAEARYWKPVSSTPDVASATHAATSKAPPVDADEIPLVDSAASWVLRKLSWSALKDALKSYLDNFYTPIGGGGGGGGGAEAVAYLVEDFQRGIATSASVTIYRPAIPGPWPSVTQVARRCSPQTKPAIPASSLS